MEVRIALTGFGSVGKGVAEILLEQGIEYTETYGVDLVLTGIADRGGAVANPSGVELEEALRVKAAHGTVAASSRGKPGLAGNDFLREAQSQVLIEAASTNFEDAEPGWSYLRAAFANHMDVVLASKGALVLHFADVMKAAEERGARVLFSGAVGAPLPVLELADRMLVGAGITGFEGIVNATANQILSTMSAGASYEEGVARAQRDGIAETDPTLDVDGWDAAAKAVIIANAVLGGSLRLPDVAREGVRGVTRADLDDARSQGQSIKLIARAVQTGSGLRAEVKPERRPLADVLGRLRGSEMGIVYHTTRLGTVAATVAGTGGLSTALTVLRDVINLARERGWTQTPGR
jgi:homoserine dehydrogenase